MVRGLIVLIIVAPVVWACSSSGVLQSVSRHPPEYTPEPAVVLLDRTGRGAMTWTSDLIAGRYGFRWMVMAGASECARQLLLDGPTVRIPLNDFGHVPAGTGEDGWGGLPSPTGDVTTGQGPPSGSALAAGRYTVSLDTDCPGKSWLTVWRYTEP